MLDEFRKQKSEFLVYFLQLISKKEPERSFHPGSNIIQIFKYYFFIENLYTISELNFFPGSRITEGKLLWLGEFG